MTQQPRSTAPRFPPTVITQPSRGSSQMQDVSRAVGQTYQERSQQRREVLVHPRPRVPPLLEVRVPHPTRGPATSGEKGLLSGL